MLRSGWSRRRLRALRKLVNGEVLRGKNTRPTVRGSEEGRGEERETREGRW
jgi:hypothetical protein